MAFHLPKSATLFRQSIRTISILRLRHGEQFWYNRRKEFREVLMRVKSAACAVVLLLLITATGCGKKPDEASGTTPTPDSAKSAASGTTPTPDSAKSVTSTDTAKESAKAKPPSVMERLTSKPVTLPEGTVLTVRLNETVSSKSNNSGDKFTATVEEPVEADGKVVIPKGATVTGTVTDAKPLGKIKGGATLRLVLDSVTVKDSKYDIQTSAVAHSLKGKGKRTAAFGGGGAGAGALIGALAGGGKGAAIGALVGGGAGLAGGAFTGNKDIVLPAETTLSFKLLKPVEVKM